MSAAAAPRAPGGKPRREMLHLLELLKVHIDRGGLSAVLLVADRKVGEGQRLTKNAGLRLAREVRDDVDVRPELEATP